MSKPEIYVSLDIEATGPIPGPYSMISLGAAAFLKERPHHVETFEINIEQLIGATIDPSTQKFWDQNKEAWEYANANPIKPKFAMSRFVQWVLDLKKQYGAVPVAVCYPAGFDWTFVYWYLMVYCKSSPFGMSCIDMKTLAMARLKIDFRDTTKSTMPKKWFSNRPHTHKALDDAIEQGYLFMNMLKDK